MSPVHWRELWLDHDDIEAFLHRARASGRQLNFLGDLNPLHVPAFGFEMSSKAIRRLPQIAAMLLTHRSDQFQAHLSPWLSHESCLKAGFAWQDLESWIRSRASLQPDVWIEWPKPQASGSQPASFMLFRRPSPGWNPQRLPELLQAMHQDMPLHLRRRLLMPVEPWWDSLWKLPLENLDQLGVDFSHDTPSWRFLFNIQDVASLFKCVQIEEPLAAALCDYPLQFACTSIRDPADYCGIEILPAYRKTWSVSNYPGRIPSDDNQWPTLPSHPAFIPARRLSEWTQASIHISSTSILNIPVGIRGGLSHQKIVLESGQVVDHKAYLGLMLTKPVRKPTDCAIELLTVANTTWQGFDLIIGTSDAWIPLACATLLRSLNGIPSVSQACERNMLAIQDILAESKPIGYSRRTPADLDSTLWLMRCQAAYGLNSSQYCEALIVSSLTDDGTLPTYVDHAAISEFVQRPEHLMDGWLSQHHCVGANLASAHNLIGSTKALAGLRDRLTTRAYVSYWWPLNTMVLNMVPRGCLPRSVVMDILAEDYLPAAKKAIPVDSARRSKDFFSSLFMLRHGNSKEQDSAELELSRLIQGVDDFKGLLMMQLPNPDIINPADQPQWIFAGNQEGAIAVDRYGCFPAAMMLSALADVGRLRSG